MPLLARVLLLILLNFQTDSGRSEHIFLQNFECTSALDDVNEELGCVCQKRSALENEDHSALPGDIY